MGGGTARRKARRNKKLGGQAPLAEATARLEITEEDQLRATWYSLFSRLLARPADGDVLRILSGLEGDGSAFGQAIEALKSAVARCSLKAIEQEYFDLFIGVGQSELVPYGSYYLTGFLHEKPLAKLRNDMARRLYIIRPA